MHDCTDENETGNLRLLLKRKSWEVAKLKTTMPLFSNNDYSASFRAVGSACMCAEGGIARAVCCGEAGGPIHDFVLVQK